jgi:hypothetical protein
VLDSSTLAATPSPDGNQTVASVARVDGRMVTLKDTQGAELTVQANSQKVAATVIPGTRVLVDVVDASSLSAGKVLK